jgi:hypothetical protein
MMKIYFHFVSVFSVAVVIKSLQIIEFFNLIIIVGNISVNYGKQGVITLTKQM